MNLKSQKLHMYQITSETYRTPSSGSYPVPVKRLLLSEGALSAASSLMYPPLSPHCPVSEDLSFSSCTGFTIRNKQASKTLKTISAVLPALAQYKACGLPHWEHTCTPHHLWPTQQGVLMPLMRVYWAKRKHLECLYPISNFSLSVPSSAQYQLKSTSRNI